MHNFIEHSFLKFQAFRGRKVDFTKKVKVYRNLTKRCYSIQQAGRVVGHCAGFRLNLVGFQVSEAARQRVISTGRKNVHAYIVGNLLSYSQSLDLVGLYKHYPDKFNAITYNPYKYNSFIYKDNERIINIRLVQYGFIQTTMSGVFVV